MDGFGYVRVFVLALFFCWGSKLTASNGHQEWLLLNQNRNIAELSLEELDRLETLIDSGEVAAFLENDVVGKSTAQLLQNAMSDGLTNDQTTELLDLISGGGQDTEGGGTVLSALTRAVWGQWETVPIAGAYCSDGSPYKIFVNKARGILNRRSRNDEKLLIYMEPGGACWDWESCSGKEGVRGAANPNGISDNYMSIADFINPRREGGSPMALISPMLYYNISGYNSPTSRWNKVFMPYCTGDVHSGNHIATYQDPRGIEPDLTFRHEGALNVQLALEYLRREFSEPSDLMVTGCSAGGTGTTTNYHFFRQALQPLRSYMLADSGPIFSAPGQGNHYPLHRKLLSAWNTGYMIDLLVGELSAPELRQDLGQIIPVLSQRYPGDRFAVTMFSRDSNYSAYSYARFFNLDESDPVDRERILQMWGEDIDNMRSEFDSISNVSYYLPYLRSMNESHCSAIVTYGGTEIGSYHAGDYIEHLLTQEPQIDFFEAANRTDADVKDVFMSLFERLMKQKRLEDYRRR